MPSTSNQVNAVTEFLIKSQVQYLATIGLDGNPKVRPFQFMLEEGDRLYFCTSNQKPVFKELQEHAYVEFCASGASFSCLALLQHQVAISLSVVAQIGGICSQDDTGGMYAGFQKGGKP